MATHTDFPILSEAPVSTALPTSALDFSYPDELLATERAPVSRVMVVESGVPRELEFKNISEMFRPGDLFVINDTRVLKRRLFTADGLEILFLQNLDESPDAPGEPSAIVKGGALTSPRRLWQVLFPASRVKNDRWYALPGGHQFRLLERGMPQTIEIDAELDEAYFIQYGELPLPPYIQKARAQRHTRLTDEQDYQSAWAQSLGSLAAPTASLHFHQADLERLRGLGVEVRTLTLHVGLGTFLPVSSDDLDAHVMHQEWVHMPADLIEALYSVRQRGGRVFALGTTVTRALESWAQGLLTAHGACASKQFGGFTRLFIRPGYQFRVVDGLFTNFHQPRSTLLALVAAFAGLATVRACYQWAIEKQFRLFSYGDLTLWMKPPQPPSSIR